MQQIYAKILYEMEKHHDTVLVTIIKEAGSAPRGTGAQMLVGHQGIILGTIGGGASEFHSVEMAKEMLSEKKKETFEHEFILRENKEEDIGMICGGNITVRFEYVSADDAAWANLAKEKANEVSQERAVLFGAGHCAMALAPVLSSVGFRVVVMDDRAELLTRERYPKAEELICGDMSHFRDFTQVGPDDYVVVMTNGHSHDYEVERQVLEGEYAYIGVIGSRRKIAAAQERLRKDGISEEAILSVHSPIGTPIKAVTPEEIAVSIAGEIIYERAVKREALGVTEKPCPMHHGNN